MTVDQLNLAPNAHAAALALREAHPTVIFTSGRRNVVDQARAMAQNVVKNPKWIRETYLDTPQSRELQAYIDARVRLDLSTIQAGLQHPMTDWTDAERAVLSKHFSGQAFDVQPVSGAKGAAIKSTIRALPHLTKFLEREGGLIRWHAQFS